MRTEIELQRVVRLENVIKIDKKSILPRNIYDEDIYIGLEDIDKETGVINTLRCAKDCDIKSNKFKFTSDHILYGKLRPNLNKVAVPGFNGICSTDIYPVLINNEIAVKRYVYHILHGQSFVKYASSRTNGVNLPRVNEKVILEYEITLPSIKIQKEIAKTLDTISELLTMRKRQLAELDNLIESTFYDMFGDPITNEKGWNKKLWVEVFNTTTGKLDANAMCEDGSYPFFTCSKEIYRINNFAFDCEALLLAGNNATANYDVKYYNGKFNAYQRTYVITLKEENEYRLFQFLLGQKLRELQSSSKGTNTKYLTMGILGRLDFIIPPISLQNHFASIVTKIEEQKAQVKKAIDETQHLFHSLMNEYFK